MARTLVDSISPRRAFTANILERLATRIVEQGDQLLRSAGIDFPSRAASTVLLIGDHAEISAADIGQALAQPHQLVTQRIDLLMDLGIVSRVQDPGDARRKTLRLTSKGKKQHRQLVECLAAAESAMASIFEEIQCDLASAATAALDALERTTILDRVRLGRDAAPK